MTIPTTISPGPVLTLPDERSGEVEGAPFTVRKGESVVVDTRRGRVRVTYCVDDDRVGGWLRTQLLDQPA